MTHSDVRALQLLNILYLLKLFIFQNVQLSQETCPAATSSFHDRMFTFKFNQICHKITRFLLLFQNFETLYAVTFNYCFATFCRCFATFKLIIYVLMVKNERLRCFIKAAVISPMNLFFSSFAILVARARPIPEEQPVMRTTFWFILSRWSCRSSTTQ